MVQAQDRGRLVAEREANPAHHAGEEPHVGVLDAHRHAVLLTGSVGHAAEAGQDEAADGVEAVEKAHALQPDVILMDLTMPRMDGEQAFCELIKLDPKVKVIISSGYNEPEIAQKFAGKRICGFLKKPYQLSLLQEAIEKLPG